MRLSLKELLIVVAFIAFGCAALKYASPGVLAAVQAVTGLLFLMMVVRAIVDRGRRQVFAIGFAVGAAIYGLVMLSDELAGEGFWAGGFGTQMASDALYGTMVREQWRNRATGEVNPDLQGVPPSWQQGARGEGVSLSQWERIPSSTQAGAGEDSADGGGSGRVDVRLSDEEIRAKAIALREALDATRSSPRPGFPGSGFGGAIFNSDGFGGSELYSFGMFLLGMSQEELEDRVREAPAWADQAIRLLESWDGSRRLTPQMFGYHIVTYQRERSPEIANFRRVGACLWMLLLGYIGGQFGRYVYARRTREAA